jgi:hypothetical protein
VDFCETAPTQVTLLGDNFHNYRENTVFARQSHGRMDAGSNWEIMRSEGDPATADIERMERVPHDREDHGT